MSVASKIAAIPKLASHITFKDVAIPETVASTLALFESNSSVKKATANEWIIDVFPDQIPVITYLSKLAAVTAKKSDLKDESKTSLATVTMYYVAILQAFLLLSDLHVRPSPSAHAQVWQNSSFRSKFADWLLTLPVPEEMESILAQYSATDLDSLKNVFVVPSAAGFDLDHYFGRFIPLTLYANMHDCIATMPGNSAPADIWSDLLPRVLFSAPSGTGNAIRQFIIADFLGIRPGPVANSKYPPTPVASKWYQCFSSTFNPVLFRDFHRRSSLATLNLEPTEKTSKASINAYDILFGATPNNLNELKVVLQSVASTINGCTSFKRNLSQVLSGQSGNSILLHGMSSFALPVAYKNSAADIINLSSCSKIAPETPTRRADHLKFLSRPTITASTAVTLTTGAADDTGLTAQAPFALILQGAAPATPAADDFLTFSDETNHYPKVHIVDFSGDNQVSAHLATLSGKLIETFELDGTVISIPNVNKPLGMQNVEFFDSAIPYKHVVRSTLSTHNGFADHQPLPRRLPAASSSLQASSLMHDRNSITIPRLATGAAATLTANIVETTVPTYFPGLTFKYMNWIKYAQSFLGFTSAITANSTTDTVIGMSQGRLYVWSPYSYTSREGAEQDNCLPDLHGNKSYFLTNLRTVFGTKSVLYEATHPMEAMPV